MGEKSTPAGEANLFLASPAAVEYSAAREAVLQASDFRIRLRLSSGPVFLLTFLMLYLL